ncbi:MAG: hypothetical protein V4489_07905 [Chlamydiota bacterium]
MINEGKRAWLQTILSSVYAASDKVYQKRIWINGIGPECDDFDETSESILGDGREILKAYKEAGMTEDQYHIFKKFRDEYEAFCDKPGLEHYLPELFIDTQEWTKITELAKEVIKTFDYHYVYPSQS